MTLFSRLRVSAALAGWLILEIRAKRASLYWRDSKIIY
jgi:hypothetical protein